MMATTRKISKSAASAPASSHVPDAHGRFGSFGGRYVPETLMRALDELVAAYDAAKRDPQFALELAELLKDYVGRPSPLYLARRLSEQCGGAHIYLKREDLNHTGAHKINNCIGQALLTVRMGKPRIIAETGAGQHGVATATALRLFGLECQVYMGEEDVRRQKLNVFKMRALGAEVRPVTSGSRTLRDAINEAMRDWMATVETHALHHRQRRRAAPVPADGARLPVGDRPRDDRSSAWSRSAGCPTWWSPASAAAATRPACSTRSSSDAGVELVGVEAGGAVRSGGRPRRHAVVRPAGRAARQLQLRPAGRRRPDCRRAFDLGRPRLSRRRPRTQLLEGHRAGSATRLPAMTRRWRLSTRWRGCEGILPALESSHAIVEAMRMRARAAKDKVIVVCLSGRGDKDGFEIARLRGETIQ